MRAGRKEQGEAEANGLSPLASLRLYLLCLVVSLGLYLLVHAGELGPGLVLGGVAILAALAIQLALLSRDRTRGGPLPDWLLSGSLIAAGSGAIVLPLAETVGAGQPLPRAVAASTIWPQILVCLFAGRALAEHVQVQFSQYWQDPWSNRQVPVQSIAAALLQGSAIALFAYQFLGMLHVDEHRLDPAAVTLRALAGQSGVHVALILLFCWLLASIADAAFLLRAEARALATITHVLGRSLRSGAPRERAIVEGFASLAGLSHMRSFQIVRHGGRGRMQALEAFHAAERRMTRAALSVLPLLGFLGTVIGLTAAIGGLPSDLDSPGARLDIGDSLFGLALKFETTLLGLIGALAGSLLLSLLERREKELEAAALRLVEAIADGE